MRPAVYASVLRNRKSGARRIQQAEHKFSWRRFFVMIFAGAVLLIPGLIVTIIGLYSDDIANIPEDRVLYKVIGPAALACGVGIMCSAGIYYCCWGLKRPVRSSRHSSKHHLKDHSDEQTDPLHRETNPVISTVSSVGHAHITSASDGSHSPAYDSQSIRHGSNNFNSNHTHRSSSKSSADGSMKGHHRHRTSSSSSHHHSHSHHHTKTVDNQVAFQNADAPLARGEASGSGDISIDMDRRIETHKTI